MVFPIVTKLYQMTKDFFYSSFWSSEIIEFDVDEQNMLKNGFFLGVLFQRYVKAEDIRVE